MGAGKIPSYVVDHIPSFGSGDEDHKPFDPGEDVALLGCVLNLYTIPLIDIHWSGGVGPMGARSYLGICQFFTVLREKPDFRPPAL